jgi:hypothetical protein
MLQQTQVATVISYYNKWMKVNFINSSCVFRIYNSLMNLVLFWDKREPEGLLSPKIDKVCSE